MTKGRSLIAIPESAYSEKALLPQIRKFQKQEKTKYIWPLQKNMTSSWKMLRVFFLSTRNKQERKQEFGKGKFLACPFLILSILSFQSRLDKRSHNQNNKTGKICLNVRLGRGGWEERVQETARGELYDLKVCALLMFMLRSEDNSNCLGYKLVSLLEEKVKQKEEELLYIKKGEAFLDRVAEGLRSGQRSEENATEKRINTLANTWTHMRPKSKNIKIYSVPMELRNSSIRTAQSSTIIVTINWHSREHGRNHLGSPGLKKTKNHPEKKTGISWQWVILKVNELV